MKELINILKSGGVAVILTDTIYGIVGNALERETVQRIYRLKKRSPEKPFIILISDLSDLARFGIRISDFHKSKIDQYWPGPVSLIFEGANDGLEYLHRGTKTLAFRLPDNESVINIIKKTGPLVAPSANPEGMLPARNIKEAKKYFGDAVDCYLEGGKPSNCSSKIIFLKDAAEIIIRG